MVDEFKNEVAKLIITVYTGTAHKLRNLRIEYLGKEKAGEIVLKKLRCHFKRFFHCN